ncbi:replication protein A 70 kDa DNA-binding subunit-like [Myzus persicae]|uniref:replication protein A 70 kDa DNA-binding subunit-like n=1 Tax=Myzus persicae TaxID=13164 RepID=UPI000B934136|nr:replication protein A 70 kDa DNA-binding subunit-like [Myzus persicae]
MAGVVNIRDIDQSLGSSFQIKARVLKVHELRTFKNNTGKLFCVDIFDATGEIRLTAFNNDAENVCSIFKKDQIFSIVNGKINKANKLYNRLNHNYEIIMGPMTIITQIEDTSDVVPTHVTLMTFDNTIGVIIRIEDIVDIVKPTKTLKLRDVIIADNTGIEVTLTLWNEEASVFSGKIEDVLSVEKGKLVVYKKGKKLSVTQSTVIQINPNWPEKEVLKEWYKNEGQYQVDRMDLTQSSNSLNKLTYIATFYNVCCIFFSITDNAYLTSVDDKIFSQIVEDEKSTKRRLDEIYILQEQLQSEIIELTFKKIRLNLERQAVENRIINRRQ